MTVHFATAPTARGDNVLLCFRNWLLKRHGTTVVADSTAGSGNVGADNLLTETKSESWRSGSVATRAGAGTPEIIVTHTLSTARAFDFVAPVWANLRLPWRADLYAGDPDASGEQRATTGWMHPIVRSETSDFTYDNFPWILGPSDERLATLAGEYRLLTFATLASKVYGIDHVRWRFDATDGDNGGVDFLQAAMLMGGEAFRPRLNMTLGTSIEPVIRSSARRTAAGLKSGIRRRTHRGFTFALEHLTDEEAVRLGTELIDEEGPFARVFAWREPEDKKRRFFYDFQGSLIGTADGFEGIAIEEPEAGMDGAIVAKSVRGIRIEETE